MFTGCEGTDKKVKHSIFCVLMHTVHGHLYCLYYDKTWNSWFVAEKLDTDSFSLLNKTESQSVPSGKWEYFGDSKWYADEELHTTQEASVIY